MDKKISSYLSKMKVFTIATSVNNIPYCANCYYAFSETSFLLIFLSDQNTRHIKEAILNKNVAGTISSNSKLISNIKGIQFNGKFIIPTENEKEEFYNVYYKKFPFAKFKPAQIWGIYLNCIKMTDNTAGFGTKFLWENTTILTT